MTTTPLAAGGSDVQFIRYDDVAIDDVVPSPHQPRRSMDQLVITSLMESIQAVVCDLNGILHTRSASCTHLGCMVHWNSLEQCWDCPCHGSQFAPDGTALNGPAIAALSDSPVSGE